MIKDIISKLEALGWVQNTSVCDELGVDCGGYAFYKEDLNSGERVCVTIYPDQYGEWTMEIMDCDSEGWCMEESVVNLRMAEVVLFGKFMEEVSK